MGSAPWTGHWGDTSRARAATSRYYEALVFVIGVCADFLELINRATCVFTWTIDYGYPEKTTTANFCFAETRVRKQNLSVLKCTEKSSFDTTLARDAVEKSNGEWRSVWHGFQDPGRFSFSQFMTAVL